MIVEEGAVSPGARTGSRRLSVVLAAAAVSGVSGYVVLIVTSRELSPAANADFLVFWGALFGVFGVLIGIATESTRSVYEAGTRAPHTDGASVVAVAAGLGVGAVVVLGLTGLVWAPSLFGDRWQGLLGLLLVGALLFAVHCGLGGSLAGSSAWSGYAGLVAAESLVRVALVAVVAVVGAGVVGFGVASAVAAGTWIALSLASGTVRHAWTARADVPTAAFVVRVLSACAAAAASAVLLVGFPVLLRATTPDAAFATAAPLLLTVSLTRAPFMVPLGAYQTIAVTNVIAHGLSALRAPLVLVAGLTFVGVGTGYALGPPVLHVVNPAYDIDRWTVAGLVLAAGLVAVLTLTAAACLALGRHALYVGGWVSAVVATVLLLLLPSGLDARTVLALVAGPVVGASVQVLRLLTVPTTAPEAA